MLDPSFTLHFSLQLSPSILGESYTDDILELGNVELKFKTRHCDSRILELNLYAESKHGLRVGQTRV